MNRLSLGISIHCSSFRKNDSTPDSSYRTGCFSIGEVTPSSNCLSKDDAECRNVEHGSKGNSFGSAVKNQRQGAKNDSTMNRHSSFPYGKYFPKRLMGIIIGPFENHFITSPSYQSCHENDQGTVHGFVLG